MAVQHDQQSEWIDQVDDTLPYPWNLNKHANKELPKRDFRNMFFDKV